jgi:cytochrome b involved in lipid metabolism
MRIPPSVLKQHRTKEDAWSAFNGKVYNITPYLAFHPGGERELMRVAGRDGTELFSECSLFLFFSLTLILNHLRFYLLIRPVKTHAWVNIDFMLDSCMVGFLVSEPS